MTRTFLVLVLGAVVGSVSVHGHHSFATFYLEDQSVSVEGSVVELEYRNPHAWVHFLAPDKDGRIQKVSAEWAGTSRRTSALWCCRSVCVCLSDCRRKGMPPANIVRRNHGSGP